MFSSLQQPVNPFGKGMIHRVEGTNGESLHTFPNTSLNDTKGMQSTSDFTIKYVSGSKNDNNPIGVALYRALKCPLSFIYG